jgi:hypothetical protein
MSRRCSSCSRNSPAFSGLGLLMLRLMVGLVFVTSGYSHLKDLEARSKSIETPKGFTIFLGIVEGAGGLGVPFEHLRKYCGGESGIRTHVRVSPKHAFQACAFNHSAISPH